MVPPVRAVRAVERADRSPANPASRSRSASSRFCARSTSSAVTSPSSTLASSGRRPRSRPRPRCGRAPDAPRSRSSEAEAVGAVAGAGAEGELGDRPPARATGGWSRRRRTAAPAPAAHGRAGSRRRDRTAPGNRALQRGSATRASARDHALRQAGAALGRPAARLDLARRDRAVVLLGELAHRLGRGVAGHDQHGVVGRVEAAIERREVVDAEPLHVVDIAASSACA